MTNCDLIDLLGKAFSDGEIDALAPHLAENCIYVSEYARERFDSAKAIIERMKYVYSNIDDTCRYTYSIVQLDKIADPKTVQSKFSGLQGDYINKYGLYLYQYSSTYPVAVVLVSQNTKDKICEIFLSRNKYVFNTKFYNIYIEEDSPYDLPSTVTPLTPYGCQLSEIKRACSEHHPDGLPEEDNLYIWRQANHFIIDWLENNGYYIRESQIQEDCIGYRCNRKNCAYTVYMYAYGQEKTTQLDGDYCEKLGQNDFSKNSTVLIVYLKVKRFMQGKEVAYKVLNYSEDENGYIELWRLSKVNGKSMLVYYPRKEMIDRIYEMMYAFNHDSLDVYDCIITEQDPEFNGYCERGIQLNDAFYQALNTLHNKYGDMKIGYVRYNDVVYCTVPYLENYGFFGFEVCNNNRIQKIFTEPFEGEKRPCAEFIKTQETADDDMYSHYPNIVEAIPLAPVETERFALKLIFENGESKKYVLPIDDAVAEDEVVRYCHHVFTDRIWQSAKIVSVQQSEYCNYPVRGQSIVFKNGFFISAYLCYKDSKLYTEPVLCNETVYEDEEIKLNRLWRWKVNSIYEEDETGFVTALVSGFARNYKGVSTFAYRDGKRLTSLDFDYTDSFYEGLACVGLAGRGYGFIDETGKLVIPTIYENADNFNNGKVTLKRDGKRYLVDKCGKETEITGNLDCKYQEVGKFYEGLCSVSTLKLNSMDLAYYSDYSEIAGIWGYVDESGNEVISPQYIYANDFEDGIAFVCKGEWTIDEKWNNEYNTGKYWTEEELWGAIDRTGKEVIPCVFDEIKYFDYTTEVFMAHYGGWENGKWGVISRTGEWIVEPIFEDIAYDFMDGLFAFYKEDKWGKPDDVPLGVYDISQRKVIFEPQFFNVYFREGGYLEVEVYDEKLGRRIEKIIDLEGNEVFPSIYSSIYTWREPYEVVISDENGSRHGLIDKEGNVLLPCKYNVAWNGISYEKRRIIVQQDGKQALIDFDDNVIIPAKYYEIHGLYNSLLTVRDGEKSNYREGLVTHNGTVVIPPEYERISWCKDNRIICCNEGNCEMLELIIKSESKSDQ